MDYVERLTVPLRWWVQGTMLVVSLWLALVVATPDHAWVAWTATAVAVGLMVLGLVSYGTARVGVVDGELVAGRARIPVALLGRAVALDAATMRSQAGVDADARAHLVLRPYLKRGVRVDIEDPADPTPYWLVSCRRPEQVVAALEQSRRSVPGTS